MIEQKVKLWFPHLFNSTEYVVKIQSCHQDNYEETYQRKSWIKDHSLSSLKNPVDELKESLCGPESVHWYYLHGTWVFPISVSLTTCVHCTYRVDKKMMLHIHIELAHDFPFWIRDYPEQILNHHPPTLGNATNTFVYRNIVCW